MISVAKSKRRKTRRNVTVGVAHIKATFNNTSVTITDTKGDTLCWASAGTSGFKGSRKSTPFAGQMAAQQCCRKGLEVRRQGIGRPRQGPGQRPRKRHHRPAGRRPDDQVDRRRHAAAAQRLPSAQEAPRVTPASSRDTQRRPPSTRTTSDLQHELNLSHKTFAEKRMARITGPVCRLCRRDGMKLFLKGTRCDTPKCAIERRDTAPGMHQYRRGKQTDYGLHLREKQKVKHYYGVLERQFRGYFSRADAHQGQHRQRADEPAGAAAGQRRASAGLRPEPGPGPAIGRPRPHHGQRPARGHPQLHRASRAT